MPRTIYDQPIQSDGTYTITYECGIDFNEVNLNNDSFNKAHMLALANRELSVYYSTSMYRMEPIGRIYDA